MKKEDIDLFLEYADYINCIGNDMPTIFDNLLKNIMGTQKCRFLLAVLMGTEAIKIQLRGLLILHEYITEIRSYSLKNGEYSIRRMKKDPYDRETFGETMNIFFKKYGSLKFTHEKLFNDIKTLNRKRNDIAHQSIIEYRGDIGKANENVKEYVMTQVMNKIQNELTTLINLKAKELVIEEEKLKKSGLF